MNIIFINKYREIAARASNNADLVAILTSALHTNTYDYHEMLGVRNCWSSFFLFLILLFFFARDAGWSRVKQALEAMGSSNTMTAEVYIYMYE